MFIKGAKFNFRQTDEVNPFLLRLYVVGVFSSGIAQNRSSLGSRKEEAKGINERRKLFLFLNMSYMQVGFNFNSI